MAQQAQRHFAFGVLRRVRQQHDEILQVLIASGSEKLQLRIGAVAADRHQQAAVVVTVIAGQAHERFLASRAQAGDRIRAPLAARCEGFEKIVDRRQRRAGQRRLDASPPRTGEEGQGHRRQAAGGHAVAEQTAPPLAQLLGEDHLVLEAHADPERDPDDDALAVVQAVRHHHLQAEHEEHRQQHGDVGGGNRPWNGQKQRGQLGHEGGEDEDRADPHAHRARGDAGELGDGDAGGVGGVRHRAGKPGEQIAHAVRRHAALDFAEVRGAWLAPGNRLHGAGIADGLDGADQSDEDERRQQGPERGPESHVVARPAAARNSEPIRLRHAGGVVAAEEGCNDAAREQAHHRHPEPQPALRPQRQPDDDEQRRAGAHRSGSRAGLARHVLEHVEDERHHSDRDQHDDRAGNRGRDDSAHPGEPRRQAELEQRGDEHQRGQHRRPAFRERRDADGDERAGRAHDDGIASPQRPKPRRLQHGGEAADQERGENRPDEIGLAAPRRPHDDDRREHDRGHAQSSLLRT